MVSCQVAEIMAGEGPLFRRWLVCILLGQDMRCSSCSGHRELMVTVPGTTALCVVQGASWS